MWAIKQTESQLYTVGCIIAGQWEPISDHDSKAEAAGMINYLNGGTGQLLNHSNKSGSVFVLSLYVHLLDLQEIISIARSYGLIHYNIGMQVKEKVLFEISLSEKDLGYQIQKVAELAYLIGTKENDKEVEP